MPSPFFHGYSLVLSSTLSPLISQRFSRRSEYRQTQFSGKGECFISTVIINEKNLINDVAWKFFACLPERTSGVISRHNYDHLFPSIIIASRAVRFR